MSNHDSLTQRPPSIMLSRDALVTELQTRSRAWRSMEDTARREDNFRKADMHHARAEVLEQLANDLLEQPLTEVRK